MPDEQDGDLLRRFVQGDRDAFESLFRQFYAEIADALGLPVGTVKSRVFRAIRALRRELARLGVQP